MGEYSITGQAVFDAALALMNETPTSIYTPDLEEYKVRAVGIINILMVELFPLSVGFSAESGGTRPLPKRLEALEDIIQMDDGVCLGVLPYGLAAHLQFGEDNVRVSFNNQRYEELREKLARGMPQEFEEIDDVYGGWEHNDFGAW